MDNINQPNNHKKFLEDKLNNAELLELNDWVNSTEFDTYAHTVWKDAVNSDFELNQKTQKELYYKISKEIEGEKIKPINSMMFYRKHFSGLMKAAAAIIFLILSTFVIRHFITDVFDPIETVVMTPKGGRTKVLLPDGTEIWMNADSKVSYSSTFEGDQRLVALEGEAFFKVTKDNVRPFIVRTSGYDVKVHGTAFKVSHYLNDISRVDLVEGKVEVIGKDQYSKFLKPHESIVYDGIRDEFKMAKNQISQEFDKESTRIIFQNESFEKILSKLERQYGVHFQVYDKRILDRKFSGAFSINERLDFILEVMSSNKTFQYNQKDSLYTIY